jgi:hypothetical protein
MIYLHYKPRMKPRLLSMETCRECCSGYRIELCKPATTRALDLSQPLPATAAYRTLLWLPLGWQCRGRRL